MNVKCSIDVHVHTCIHYPSSKIINYSSSDFDHFVLRLFEWLAHYFLSNSVVHAFRCHQSHEFRLHVCRTLHDIAVEGLQSAKNTVDSQAYTKECGGSLSTALKSSEPKFICASL